MGEMPWDFLRPDHLTVAMARAILTLVPLVQAQLETERMLHASWTRFGDDGLAFAGMGGPSTEFLPWSFVALDGGER